MGLKGLLDSRRLSRWVILIYSKYDNDHLIYNEYLLVEVHVYPSHRVWFFGEKKGRVFSGQVSFRNDVKTMSLF